MPTPGYLMLLGWFWCIERTDQKAGCSYRFVCYELFMPFLDDFGSSKRI